MESWIHVVVCVSCVRSAVTFLLRWQLESSRLFLLWLQTVFGVARCGWMQFIELLGPNSLLLKGTLALHSSSVIFAKQHNMSICLGGKERKKDIIQFKDMKKCWSISQLWIEFSRNYLSFMHPPSSLWTFSSFHDISSSVKCPLPSRILSALTYQK